VWRISFRLKNYKTGGCDQVIRHVRILILSKTRPAVKAMPELTPETYWRAREDRWPGSSGQREGRGSSGQHALSDFSVLYCFERIAKCVLIILK
jgi:hypothetical protein